VLRNLEDTASEQRMAMSANSRGEGFHRRNFSLNVCLKVGFCIGNWILYFFSVKAIDLPIEECNRVG
jgi:hypothetical protein